MNEKVNMYAMAGASGTVIALEKSEYSDYIEISWPALVFSAAPDPRTGRPQMSLVPFIPEFIEETVEYNKCLTVRKALILFKGTVKGVLKDGYLKWQKARYQQVTGVSLPELIIPSNGRAN